MNAILEKSNEIMNITDPSTWPIWLTLTEVAAVLRLSERTIAAIHLSGKLPGRRFGKRLRWHRDQVLKYAG